jgi:small subunit ribosomal protein S5
MAIEKANKQARKNMIKVPLVGDTVCHEQVGEHKSSRILIKPAAPGTGVKAGATVRDMMSVLGVHNVLTKSLGNHNPINLAQATMNALREMRSVEEVEELRGARVELRNPQWQPRRPPAAEAETEEQPAAPAEAEQAEQTE